MVPARLVLQGFFVSYNCRWALTVKTNAVKYGIDDDELKDDVTVASNPTYGRDPWLVINHEMAPATVHGQVYYMKNKPELTYTLPSGAQLIGETDLNFNEPGTKPATSLNNGYLVWVWSVDRQKQPGNWGKYMDANYLDGWGAEDEVVTLPKQEEPAPTPTPTPGEATPTPAPEPTPNPSETTPAPINPTPGETTPAPAPSTPGDATTDPTPAPNGTTKAPTPGSQENGDKDGKSGATNGTENGNTPSAPQNGSKSANGSTSVDHQGAALARTGSTTLPLLGGATLLLVAGAGLALTKRVKA